MSEYQMMKKRRQPEARDTGGPEGLKQANSPNSALCDIFNSQEGASRNLSHEMKSKMEDRFGRSMSGLKIVESPDVREAGARAYARGNVIRFAPGQFDQHTSGGQMIIEHEIAHVIQQSRGQVRSDTSDSPLATDSGLEARADNSAFEAGTSSGVTAPLGAMSFSAAPVQMWPWSKKKPQTNTGTVPGGPTTHQVDTGKFNFGKKAYKDDSDLVSLKAKLDMYNSGEAGPEAEKELMTEAYRYIDKFSTGKKAVHKGRTSMAEDIIYQLSMKGGTKERADANIDRLKGLMTVADPTKETELKKQGAQTLEGLRSLYSPKGKYSKTMQAISADVMSRQSLTEKYIAGGKSGATQHTTQDSPTTEKVGYDVQGRVTDGKNDALGTNLHEFTHVANGEVFKNTDMLLSYKPGDSKDSVIDEMRDRARRTGELRELSKGSKKKISSKSLSEYTTDRTKYATGWKAKSNYIMNSKNMLTKTVMQSRGEDTTGMFDAALNPITKAQLPGMMDDVRGGRINAGALANPATRQRMSSEYDKINSFNDIVEEVAAPYKAMHDDEVRQRDLRFDIKRGLSKDKEADQRELDALNEKYGGDVPDVATEMEKMGPDAMIEYDSVMNQMLAQYEASNRDRKSEYYRKLKSAALGAHVRRHNAGIN